MLNKLLAVYKFIFSPIVQALGGRCRFYPSCSEYAVEAFEKYPPTKAIRLTVSRLFRCSPWSSGGIDSVPLRKELKDEIRI